MKKILLFIICAFVALLSHAASTSPVNVYATRLSLPNNGVVDGNHQTSFKFYVMAETDEWWIYLDIDKDGDFTDEEPIYHSTDNIEVNSYQTVTCSIPDDIPAGEYQWAVKVRAVAQGRNTPLLGRNYENSDKRYLFREAMGLAIDCSYESEYLGYSYVAENNGGTTTSVSGTGSRTTKDGIYIFGPAMGVGNDGNAYTGGVSWNPTSDYRERGPFRVCTDDEGYVYVCENRPAAESTDVHGGALVWRMHPSDLTKSMQVVLKQSDLNGLNKRIHSIAVTRDANGNKVLYGIFGGTSDGALTSGQLGSFIINDSGNSITITQQSKIVNLYADHKLVSIYTSIVPGKHGDLWIFQHRGESSSTYPTVIHLDNTMTVDKKIYANELLNLRGSGALSHDGSVLAVNGNVGSDKNIYVHFYNVTYDASNKSKVQSISRNTSFNIATPRINGYTGTEFAEGMAFDVADNLYILSGNNSNANVDRLYVYSYPKGNNNEHLTPARSALTIKISSSEHICWHPYPEGYQVTNEDLFEMFKVGYKAYTRNELLYTENDGKIAISSNPVPALVEFMTNENSPWKWLGDYIIQCGAQRQDVKTLPTDMDSNSELWEKFMPYYNSYNGTSRAEQTMANANIFCNESKPTYNVLSGNNSKFKWLGDYIIAVAKQQGKTLDGSYTLWPHVVKAFFNRTTSYQDGIDFTSAGAPSAWGPAYLESTIHNEAIDIDHEWRVCLNNFFNISKEKTDSDHPFIVDYTTAGKPSEWNDEWLASFPTTPSKVKARGALPYLSRKGHVFAGWYFGNDHTSAAGPGYNKNALVTVQNIASACIYGRWLEETLYEGYVAKDPLDLFSTDYINNNIELINATSGSEYSFTINRRLQGGMYNTLCFPFSVTKEDISNIYYVDTEEKPLERTGTEYPFSIVQYDNTEIVDNKIVLNFSEVDEDEVIAANMPFLIKTNVDITRPFKFSSSKMIVRMDHIAPADDGEAESTNYGDNYGHTIDNGDFAYTGVLAPTMIPANSCILVTYNQLATTQESGEMLGMRGFFTLDESVQEMPATIKIVDKDKTATSVEDIQDNEPQVRKILHNGQIYILRGNEVYDLNGRLLRKQ
jgi:hypothetical protein